MSGSSGDLKGGAVKTVGTCLLSLLLSTVAGGVSAAPSGFGQPPTSTPVSTSSAATLASLHMPFAGGAVRDARPDRQNPNSTPIPAPPATNHYANSLLTTT